MTDQRLREPADLNDRALRARAIAAARGDAPFDVLIAGGTLVDVVTGELRAADIGLVGPLIASVHAAAGRRDAAEIVDAAGAFVALCTTLSHDSQNLTVFGGNPADMAIAANAVIAGGGMAVASAGKLDALLPLPLSGLISAAALPDIAAGFQSIRNAVDRIADWQPPYRVFKACFGATLACNAGKPGSGEFLGNRGKSPGTVVRQHGEES